MNLSPIAVYVLSGSIETRIPVIDRENMDFSPKAVYVVSSSIETRIPIIDRESRNISQCNRVGLLILLLIGKTWTFPLKLFMSSLAQ
jgi:hypothetical protein